MRTLYYYCNRWKEEESAERERHPTSSAVIRTVDRHWKNDAIDCLYNNKYELRLLALRFYSFTVCVVTLRLWLLWFIKLSILIFMNYGCEVMSNVHEGLLKRNMQEEEEVLASKRTTPTLFMQHGPFHLQWRMFQGWEWRWYSRWLLFPC